MVSTFTTNVQLEEPARGDDVGTWDTPVNANMTALDLMLGGVTTISGAAGSVVLAAAQFQCKTLVLNSTLIANITLTFPTSFKKSYEIQHACTGSSQFVITLQTTATGGQVICVPPGETTEFFTDGSNVKYKNLGRIGTYWDYAGSSVPGWVSGCTIPPYLNCDGSAVSSGTYPQLFGLVGATLPDTRGRYRATLDQSVGRLSSAVAGFSPNTVGAGGSAQTVTLVTANLPPYTPAGTVANTPPGVQVLTFGAGGPAPSIVTSGNAFSPQLADTSVFTGTPQGGTSTPVSNISPTYIGGLTLIRAG